MTGNVAKHEHEENKNDCLGDQDVGWKIILIYILKRAGGS
jgi:hypothetical protein